MYTYICKYREWHWEQYKGLSLHKLDTERDVPAPKR